MFVLWLRCIVDRPTIGTKFNNLLWAIIRKITTFFFYLIIKKATLSFVNLNRKTNKNDSIISSWKDFFTSIELEIKRAIFLTDNFIKTFSGQKLFKKDELRLKLLVGIFWLFDREVSLPYLFMTFQSEATSFFFPFYQFYIKQFMFNKV
ncbi:hypothetical protein BpHYR1_050928 [Brachionus plicatilis]|uniref:Uncharacterized protein n=1 Tax=Brachionus plicatilis TaxID=10195 RepID=A0A3M7R1J4_BRAPC|nr:hypothetical protein BpHYR1_050928 [Brachionus plicatilis]